MSASSQQASKHHQSILSSETSVWLVQGPRVSDEMYADVVEVERRVSRDVYIVEEASENRESQDLKFADAW